MNSNESITKFAQWGLPLDEINQLEARLKRFYDRFHSYVCSKTHDTSEYGLRYVSGLLRMEARRTMANISRKTSVSIQNMHHFISNSPWSGQVLIGAVQDDIRRHPEFLLFH